MEGMQNMPPEPMKTSIEDVISAFGAVKQYPVTARGQSGYFVEKHGLKVIEDLLRKYSTEPNADPTQVEAMANRLHDLKGHNDEAHSQLRQYKADLANTKEELADARRQLDINKKMTTKYGQDKGTIEAMKAMLNSKQLELGKAKVTSKAAMKDDDPDVHSEAIAIEDKLRQQVADYSDQLASAKHKASERVTEFERLRTEVNRLVASEASLYKQVSAYQSMSASALSGAKVDVPFYTINAPMVKLLIGQKGIEWLSKLDYQSRLNLRDYAHHLMGAANSSKATRGIADLLKIVANWLKSKAYAARERVRPWLALIEKDLAAGVVNTIAFYRDELRKIVADFEQYKEQTNARFKGRSAATKAAIAAGKTAGKTIRRWTRPTTWWNAFKSAAKSVQSFVTRGWTSIQRRVFGPTVTGEDLFNADELEKELGLTDEESDTESVIVGGR